MLSIGYRLTDPNESLRPITLAEIHGIITTDASLQTEVTRLRKLATLDKTTYRTLKTRLPYVVGSIFVEGKRLSENLQAAHYFILDFDDFPLTDSALRQRLLAHASVALVFVSPGGQGLKVFCPLDEPCTDPKAFSEAYKAFGAHFADEIRLIGSLDYRTSDATRACFLSHDPEAFFRKDALPVAWKSFLPQQSLSFDHHNPFRPEAPNPTDPKPINEGAYKAILKKINPNAPVRRDKQTFVPEILYEIMPIVQDICLQHDVSLVGTQPLNYGLKLMIKKGTRNAEINLHFGKKGFSIVKSPKTGTDPQLSEWFYGVLFDLLFRPEND
ncbi:MAG: CRISPR-associated primase-polymerase type B [Runella sp.]